MDYCEDHMVRWYNTTHDSVSEQDPRSFRRADWRTVDRSRTYSLSSYNVQPQILGHSKGHRHKCADNDWSLYLARSALQLRQNSCRAHGIYFLRSTQTGSDHENRFLVADAVTQQQYPNHSRVAQLPPSPRHRRRPPCQFPIQRQSHPFRIDCTCREDLGIPSSNHPT